MESNAQMRLQVVKLTLALHAAEQAYDSNPTEENMARLANAAILLALASGA